MTRLITITLYLLISFVTYGQDQKTKVRIALLGSMHFTPSTQDEYSNEGLLLTTQKRKELEEVISQLVAFKPDQIVLKCLRQSKRTSMPIPGMS